MRTPTHAIVRATPGGARLRVRVIPKSSADRIDGLGADSDGVPYLKVRVRAAPENGAANEAVEALLAKRLGAPKTRVRVAQGAGGRLKTIDIDGAEAAALARRIDALLEDL